MFNLDNKKMGEIRIHSLKQIAIVGIGINLPQAESYQQFWNNLCVEKDCIGILSDIRQSDIKECMQYLGKTDQIKFRPGAYLDRIDEFDNEFFHISYKEASLMDPNQRLFLQTAWHSIEDAGYAPEKLSNSRTGVFLGYSSSNEYQQMIAQVSPKDIVLAETGNINSIIASRISYILNLRGPSMVIDTACSSSLVAIHLACQFIQNGEVDNAIVGGSKIWLMPQELNEHLGIESSSGRTRTFDEDSDGTGFGEGVIAIMLKSLSRAINDRNHIYAVIEESGTNQDGASVGITAPNMKAQEQLLTTVWCKAGISPEKITYIETHGTGTKLGDPIEVNAIDHAFSKYTDKKQFCGVGSVKTNLGHLDGAAGIAGFTKTVLALYFKKIPATLHFNFPNNKIDFINSAVYVNHELMDWDDEERYAGVSAFGLSGTNCHVLLKNYKQDQKRIYEGKLSRYVLPISAKTYHSLMNAVDMYYEFIKDTREELDDICYTASVGRTQYNYRLLIVAKDKQELLMKLSYFAKNRKMDISQSIYYGYFIVVPTIKKKLEESEVYEEQIEEITKQAQDLQPFEITDELIQLYMKGAQVNWEKYYSNRIYDRVSIPVYSFEKKRCWISNVVDMQMKNALRGEKIEADEYHMVYRTLFSLKQWFLNEHCIIGNYIAPGTVFIEMIYSMLKENNIVQNFAITDLFFVSPLIVEKNQEIEVNMSMKKKENEYLFTVYSEEHGKVKQYCKGTVIQIQPITQKRLDINRLFGECTKHNDIQNDKLEGLDFGPRWSTIKKEIHVAQDFYFVKLSLAMEYFSDLKNYNFHPALLDMAINAVTQLTGFGIYLPYCYEWLELYYKLPSECYSYIEVKQKSKNNEIITFDIIITDLSGTPLIKASNYAIKKININNLQSEKALFYKEWILCKNELDKVNLAARHVLIFEDDRTSNYLKDISAVRVNISNNKKRKMEKGINSYSIGCTYENIEKVLVNELYKGIDIILISASLAKNNVYNSIDSIEYQQYFADLLRYLVQVLHKQIYRRDIQIFAFTRNSYSVNHQEPNINHILAAFLTMGCVASQENSKIHFYGIDLDDKTIAMNQISQYIVNSKYSIMAYREGKKYVEIIRPYVINQNEKYSYKDGGVYVITGGGGEIGRNLAVRIAENAKAHIVLLGRKMQDKLRYDIELNHIIQKILEQGSTIDIISCDVTDKIEVASAFDDIGQKYHSITGVFHTAGIIGKGFLFDKTDEQFRQVIKPKVDGTLLVDWYSKKYGRQFMVLFSSVSSIYRGAGESDYVFANAFMDSYMNESNDILTINFPAFSECGMAKRMKKEDNQIFHMISNQEAFQKLEQLLMHLPGNVIVGRINQEQLSNLEGKIWMELDDSFGSEEVKKEEEDGKLDKDSNVEATLIQIWEQVMGIEQIDIYKDFQDYGGDSITAAAIYSEIKKHYNGMVDIDSVFSYPSIFEMTEYISNQIKKKQQSESKEITLDDILQEVCAHKMSVGDAVAYIWGNDYVAN